MYLHSRYNMRTMLVLLPNKHSRVNVSLCDQCISLTLLFNANDWMDTEKNQETMST